MPVSSSSSRVCEPERRQEVAIVGGNDARLGCKGSGLGRGHGQRGENDKRSQHRFHHHSPPCSGDAITCVLVKSPAWPVTQHTPIRLVRSFLYSCATVPSPEYSRISISCPARQMQPVPAHPCPVAWPSGNGFTAANRHLHDRRGGVSGTGRSAVPRALPSATAAALAESVPEDRQEEREVRPHAGSQALRRNSCFAIASRCTSSGPSAIRSTRACP